VLGVVRRLAIARAVLRVILLTEYAGPARLNTSLAERMEEKGAAGKLALSRPQPAAARLGRIDFDSDKGLVIKEW